METKQLGKDTKEKEQLTTKEEREAEDSRKVEKISWIVERRKSIYLMTWANTSRLGYPLEQKVRRL